MFHDKCGTLLVHKTVDDKTIFYCPACKETVDRSALPEDQKIVFKGAGKRVLVSRRGNTEGVADEGKSTEEKTRSKNI